MAFLCARSGLWVKPDGEGLLMLRKLMLALMLLLLTVMGSNLTGPGACLAQGLDIRIADGRGDWGSPNPYRHYPRGPGYIRLAWVFDTLIWKDKDGYVPALAQKWSYEPKEMVFSFELCPKAKWHDGKPLTADDVVFTVGYFKKHPYRWVTVDYIGEVKATGPPQRGDQAGQALCALFWPTSRAPCPSCPGISGRG